MQVLTYSMLKVENNIFYFHIIFIRDAFLYGKSSDKSDFEINYNDKINLENRKIDENVSIITNLIQN